MRYLEIDAGPFSASGDARWWERALEWGLRDIVPAVNPDLEQYICASRVWWLEIDDEGTPLRELGFDVDGKAIVLGPVAGNHGYLIDSSDDWSDSDEDSRFAAENFERVWAALWPEFEELERRISGRQIRH
jgi:hypothetical protein